MTAVIVIGILSLSAVLFLLLAVMSWLDRRNFLVLKEGPHKSCIRLADQLDTVWRRNRRRQRDL